MRVNARTTYFFPRHGLKHALGLTVNRKPFFSKMAILSMMLISSEAVVSRGRGLPKHTAQREQFSITEACVVFDREKSQLANTKFWFRQDIRNCALVSTVRQFPASLDPKIVKQPSFSNYHDTTNCVFQPPLSKVPLKLSMAGFKPSSSKEKKRACTAPVYYAHITNTT